MLQLGTMLQRLAYRSLTTSVILVVLFLLAGLFTLRGQAKADRVVLMPAGSVLAANSFQMEYEVSPYRQYGNLTWLQYSLPQGIELELQRYDLEPDPRALYSFNVQYPLFYDIGNLPAVSVGVRDLLGTGNEHRSFYVAATRTFALSDRQMHVLREFHLSAGFGTERMNGLFIGLQARLTLGLRINAEIYRQRPNVSIALPLVRNLQARASSLDGNIFYGLAFTARR
jgi:hypothetical protein